MQTPANSNKPAAIQDVRDDELDLAVGGLNPQPIPPKEAFVAKAFSAKSLPGNTLAPKGIIIVGG